MTRHTWAVAGISGAGLLATAVTAWLLYAVVVALLGIAQDAAAIVHAFDGAWSL